MRGLWEGACLDAMVADPRMAAICGDLANFWRDPEEVLGGASLGDGGLRYLATKFIRFRD